MVNYTPHLVKEESNPFAGTVDEIMVRSFTFFRESDSIESAVAKIVKEDLTGAPVLDENRRPVGFLSQKDCLKFATQLRYLNEEPGQVRDYMSHDHCCLTTRTKVFDAIQSFINKWFHTYPVVDEDGKVVGLLSRNQILRLVNKTTNTSWRGLKKAG